MNVGVDINNDLYKNVISWKKYRLEEINNIDFLLIIDLILNYESKNGKNYTNKIKNIRYVELKSMKREDLCELLLNCEISSLSSEQLKKELLLYEYRMNELKINSTVKNVEYVFDNNKLKFWDNENIKNSYEIDLNTLINWDSISTKATELMKEKFSKNTSFVNINDNEILRKTIKAFITNNGV